MRYSKTTLLLALIGIIAAVPLFKNLSVNFVPPEDRGFLFAFVLLPSGLPSEKIKQHQDRLEAILKNHPHTQDFLGVVMQQNLLFMIRLQPQSMRPPQDEVMESLKTSFHEIPGIEAYFKAYQLFNLDFEFDQGGQYKYIITGLDFKEVDEAAQQLVKALKSHPDIEYARGSHEDDAAKLVVKVNEPLAARLGVTKQHIQDLLQQAYGQGSAGSIQKGATQEKIYMDLQSDYKNHVGALAKLSIKGPNDQWIPLKALATWEEQLGSPALKLREQMPYATLRFSLKDTQSPNKGLQSMETYASSVLPAHVKGFLDGFAKRISSALKDTLLLLLAATLVMYVVLGILYESFIHPLTILSSLPFAALGGIFTLSLFNEPLSIFSAVGFLLLIGIVKKNGIMVVDYALEAQKQGQPPEQAIVEGCLVRFRPIMMTTAAAIMGAVPIAIGFGDGGEMRRGLGLVIVGGLLFSQLLTLYVTPIVYLAFEKISRFLGRDSIQRKARYSQLNPAEK